MTTDWRRYDVPALTRIVGEDLEPAWQQVLAWEQSFSLLNGHSSRLALARDALAQTWAPDHSPAAQAFFGAVDQTVSSMASNADAAIANRDALAGVLTALEAARARIDRLHAAWLVLERDEAVASVGGVVTVVPPKDWRQQLNDQAHAVMAATDQAIFESSQQFIVPGGEGPIEPHTPIPNSGPNAVKSPPPMQLNSGANAQHLTTAGTLRTQSKTTLTSGHLSTTLPSYPVGASAAPEMPPEDEQISDQRLTPFTSVPEPWPTTNGIGAFGVLPSLAVGLASGAAFKSTSGAKPQGSGRPSTRPTSEEPFGPPLMPGAVRNEEDSKRTGTRRTRWSILHGIPGLIAPDESTEIPDPGPGVIGLDR